MKNSSTAVSSDGQSKNPARLLVLPRPHFRPTRTRESTPANAKILSLREIHEGVKYFDPNSSRLESLAAKRRTNQSGLGDSDDESDAIAKVFLA